MGEIKKYARQKMKFKNAWDVSAHRIDNDAMRIYRYSYAINFLKQILKNNKEAKILDIGCGEGFGVNLAINNGYKNTQGIEVSTERIDIAKNRYGQTINIQHYSGRRLPYKDSEFDVVLSLAVIEHTSDKNKFVGEISRVLKRNGLAIIGSDCYTWRILQLLGFYRSVQPIDKTVTPGNYVKIFRKYNLKLIGYKTFNHPSRKVIYINQLLTSYGFSKTLSNNFDDEEIFRQVSEVKMPNPNFKELLLSFWNDENIFVLRKQR